MDAKQHGHSELLDAVHRRAMCTEYQKQAAKLEKDPELKSRECSNSGQIISDFRSCRQG